MKCCPRCFNDRFLEPLIERNSECTGRCDFCSSQGVALYSTDKLADEFETLIALYEVSADPSAGLLDDLIQRDWKIFSHNNYRSLLREIVQSLDVDFSQEYRLRREPDEELIEKWSQFTEELKHANRYFPQSAPNEELLTFLLGNLGGTLSQGTVVYRARINTGRHKFAPQELGKPPHTVAVAGRANPEGISYFYTASTFETAVAEIRPQPGDTLTVAQFETQKHLALIDLRDPYLAFTPFGHEGDLEEILFRGLPLLKHLGDELTKPVQRGGQSQLAYLPSQYLCEFIKKNGNYGVIYRSSLRNGDNYATFDDDSFAYVSCREVVVESIDVRTRYTE